MKKTLSILFAALATLGAAAQTALPCGVYEGADKAEGVLRQLYLEINLEEPVVPDFSQTFTKGKEYSFKLLPKDFMKKPSGYFKGKKAYGYVKYRCKFALSNTEISELSDPQPTKDGWTLTWRSDFGKKGTCELRVVNDSTLTFVGLGAISKELKPNGLQLVKVSQPIAEKPYLTPKLPPAPQKPDTPGAEPAGPTPQVPYTAPTDANGKLLIPKENTGLLKGSWLGNSGISLKVNSQAATFDYGGRRYYGIVRMDGPGYIHEGIVRVTKIAPNEYVLYTVALDTDDITYHWQRVVLPAEKDELVQLWPTGGPRELDQMGKPLRRIIFYGLSPVQPWHSGKFSTGSEVQPFKLDFTQKDWYDSGYGDLTNCYGVVHSSYNGGRHIDHDVILEARIADDGSVLIVYECGRTGNKYKALLVYDPAAKSYSVKQTVRTEGDEDDCNLSFQKIKFLGN